MLDRPGEGVVVRAVVAEVLHLGRRSRRDRHHVVRRKRDRGRRGSRRNRHGLRERILTGSVGHRVLIFRMSVAVVGPSTIGGGDRQGLRGSRDFQRARNTCNVVVCRHIVVGGIADHHTILRDRDRILASRHALTCQSDSRDSLVRSQTSIFTRACNRVVRFNRIGCRSIRDRCARVLVARVIRRQLERTGSDLLRQIVNHSVVVNTFRSGKTVRSTSQGYTSCIGVGTNVGTVGGHHTGRDSIVLN